VSLVDRSVERASVYFAGGRHDHFFHAAVFGGGQHVEASHRVDFDDFAGVQVRVRYADQRGEMENHLGLIDQASNRVEIANVTGHYLELLFLFTDQSKDAGVVAGVVADEGGHARAKVHKLLHQVAPDE